MSLNIIKYLYFDCIIDSIFLIFLKYYLSIYDHFVFIPVSFSYLFTLHLCNIETIAHFLNNIK